MNVFAFVLRLTGTLTLSETVPFEQGSVVGSPARVGVEEKVQLVALVICAVSDKAPPEAPREVGAEGERRYLRLRGCLRSRRRDEYCGSRQGKSEGHPEDGHDSK